VSENVGLLILDHEAPGTRRVWRSRELGYFGRWRDCTVETGQLDDGRWWVRRTAHPVGGGFRAELYDSQQAAVEVARAVMAEIEPALIAAGWRPFRES
jgi:hypothetical protein